LKRGEASEFDSLLAALRNAFERRLPFAREKAERTLEVYTREARALQRRSREAAEAIRCGQRVRAIQKLLHEHRNANLLGRPDVGPTPEAATKPGRYDPIKMLLVKNKLHHGHERAAREIAHIYESVVSALMPSARRLDGLGGGGRFNDLRLSERVASLHHGRYLPWTKAMGERKGLSLPLVIDVVVDGASIEATRKRHRMAHGKVIRLLADGLALYAEIAGWRADEAIVEGRRRRPQG